jgi:dTDP-4-amino-4,6-dideoxygalactose transaminase
MTHKQRINFGDLKLGDVAKDRLIKALEKNWITEGENVSEFEEIFSQKFGYRHVIATNNGTSACIAALCSLYETGAQRNDEVIVPACTFAATANAILAAGFIPKFVDVDLNTLNIDPEKIGNVISKKTAGIMPVHLMGKPCEMDQIMELSEQHSLPIIEDCCEAHGAKYKGNFVGSFGLAGAFSFYVAHVITAGEGGLVVTNDDKIADVIRSSKSHGRPVRSTYFSFERFGLNLKMNDLVAAVGIEGLLNYEDTFIKRKQNVKTLLGLMDDLHDSLYLMNEESYEDVSPHAFPLVLKNEKQDCERFYNYLESNGIQCKTLFGSLPTQHEAFSFLNYEKGSFVNAEYIGRNGLHFGVHQYLTQNDLIRISDLIHNYFNEG